MFNQGASGGAGSQLAAALSSSLVLRDPRSAHTGRSCAAGKHTLNETRMFTLAQSPRSCSEPAGPMAAARARRGSQWERRFSTRAANERPVLQPGSQWRAGTGCNHATSGERGALLPTQLPLSCWDAGGKIEHGKHVGRKLGLQRGADRALHRQLLQSMGGFGVGGSQVHSCKR